MHRGPSKEQLAKDQEREENMPKMLTQLDRLTKHVVGENQKSVNVIVAAGDVVYDNLPYDGGYNKEVHYMGNQMMGSHFSRGTRESRLEQWYWMER